MYLCGSLRMRNLIGFGLLLLVSVAYSARLPEDVDLLSKSSNSDELEELDQSFESKESSKDDSSPVETRYEVPDTESSEEGPDYDAALEEILEDIVDTLQTHPELMKELIRKSPNGLSTRPEAGKEIIDDHYPRTDASEESRELNEYLNIIQTRGEVDPIINIQEGGQDDPMFDFERLREQDTKVLEAKNNTGKNTGFKSEQNFSEETESNGDEKAGDKELSTDSDETETDENSIENTRQ